MPLPARLRCPCGTLTAPALVPRGGRASKLAYLRCPVCRLTTYGTKLERLTEAWNETVERELERMREMGANHR